MGSAGPRPTHRLRSEKSHRQLGRRGFDSPHLHRFPGRPPAVAPTTARGSRTLRRPVPCTDASPPDPRRRRGAGGDRRRLRLPEPRPAGHRAQRYRDPIFTAAQIAKTSDVTYGSATNLSSQTVTLKLDVWTPPASDTVTERPAIVWIHGGSFSGGDKTSPELLDEMTTFTEQGYVNLSINYRLEPGGCSAGASTPSCIGAIQEATQDGQTASRGSAATPRPTASTPRGSRSPGPRRAPSPPRRWATSRARRRPRPCAPRSRSPARTSSARDGRRRTGAVLPRHRRPPRPLPVGRQHRAEGARRTSRRVPRDLAGRGPRALRAVPRPDPHPDAQLPVVGDEPRAGCALTLASRFAPTRFWGVPVRAPRA